MIQLKEGIEALHSGPFLTWPQGPLQLAVPDLHPLQQNCNIN